MQTKGIDISHWQGVVDFKKVKDAGIDFVIIKAGGSDKGTYKDNKFETYYDKAKENGLNVGSYYFVGKNCKSILDGEADAKRFIEIVKGKKFEYPLYIDFEAPDTTNKKGNTDACITFCRTLEKAGFYAGIYASDISGFKERLELDRLSPFDLWVARYGKSPQYVDKFGVWQYSSEGRISGITGNVDLDISYKSYPLIMRRAKLNGFID